jgi:outer membrane receptor protein involved in Fe transport
LTLSITPALITRQRQNLGQTRACGVELDGQFRPANHFAISGGYLFADSRVVDFPPDRTLENLRVPQVARHQFTFQFQYSNDRYLDAGVQFRAGSSQFDDDQNRFRLGGYSTLDGSVSRKLTSRLRIFAAIENALGTEIESGRTPVLTLAAPRTVRVGLRLRLR